MQPHPLIIEKFVKKALIEDLGHGFDLTSQILIPGDKEASAVLKARQNGIIAGLIPALTAFTLSDPDFDITVNVNDGDIVEKGDIIAELSGPARAMLIAERTCLNIISHLSGIATLTNTYAQTIEGFKTQVTCTRKTLPGLRNFQKYAVLVGGGSNHRYGLDDAILIKDNHIDVAGSIEDAISAVKMVCGHTKKIEIEVESLKQVEQVLKHGGVDIIMLDNMDIQSLKKAVDLIKGQMITEASGGITLATIRAVAETGVDYISCGVLTNSAPALDIGLDIKTKSI